MRLSRGVSFLLAPLLLVLAPGKAWAQAEKYLGRPVTTVRLMLEGRETTEPALVDVVETRSGAPLSMVDVRETVTHLFSLGRFENVSVDASAAGAGVALRYDLTPIHPVAKIEFAGGIAAPGINSGALRRAVTDRFGLSPSVGRATEIEHAVQDVVREAGYLHADVTARASLAHAPDRATLVLSVVPHDRTLVRTIDVVGVAPPLQADVRTRLHLAPGEPYEKQALETRIDRYVQDRRNRGYYEAKVVASVRLADGDRVADLTITVVPGPLVHVVFAGDSLPSDKRTELVPVEREGSADEDLLEDSSNRIEEYLRGLGYRQASAPHTREERNGEVFITFTVGKGPQWRVERVEISGNSAIALTDLAPRLRLREGQPFSDANLDTDVSSIAGEYRRRGYADVSVQPAIDPVAGSDGGPQRLVDIRIGVREGARTSVGSVRIRGNDSVPEATLRERIRLQPGIPFYAAQMAADRDALQLEYQDLGYLNATVDAARAMSADNTLADVVFTIHEGPRIFVDHVLIVGNVRTSNKTIVRALQINPGDPLGQAALNDAQQRLAALGLFRRLRIAELRHGEETRRDLLITVEEAPATTIGYGAGGELRARVVRTAEGGGVASEQLELAPRASFQIGRRNLWGKNRSVDLFTSVSLHPKDSPVFANQPGASSGGGYGFPEYRIQGTFREPRLFDTAADAYLTGTLEQQIRSSFNFARQSAGAGVGRRLTRNVSVTGSYQLQRTRVFDLAIDINPADKLAISRLFPQVRLSSFSSSVIRDTRDDQVDPHRGEYLSANAQLAARALGSEVGFAKSFLTAQFFRPMPHVARIVLAGSARLGLAAGFPRVVTVDTAGDTGEVKDLPLSERFFAGGDTTVRGFALDRLGVQHIPPQLNDTLDKDGFPLGGNGLVVLNGELRAPVRWGVSAVGFLDIGNVFAHPGDIDPTELRGSAGVGIRWKSPLGPFRIDWGFKLHRNEIAPGVRESAGQIWFSFGQAF